MENKYFNNFIQFINVIIISIIAAVNSYTQLKIKAIIFLTIEK